MNHKQMKEDCLNYRKAREAATAALLTTVIAKAESIAKDGKREHIHEDFILAIKSFLKGIDVSIEECNKASRDVSKLVAERDLLLSYLPKQLSPEEIKSELFKIYVDLEDKSSKAMGALMGGLSAKHIGQSDNKTASLLARAILQKRESYT